MHGDFKHNPVTPRGRTGLGPRAPTPSLAHTAHRGMMQAEGFHGDERMLSWGCSLVSLDAPGGGCDAEV